MYRILTPRQLSVYCYLCSVFDRHGIAYPTVEQIRADLDIQSAIVVKRALDKLVELGFVLRGHKIKGRLLSRRAVYQRPLAAYTLVRLLELDLIDARLYPRSRSETAPGRDFTDSAVDLGLKNLLGETLYAAYRVSSDRIRGAVLLECLRRRIAAFVIAAAERAKQLPPDVPVNISALIADDEGIPF